MQSDPLVQALLEEIRRLQGEIEVAYTAGFFDGEGSVNSIRIASKRSASYKVHTSVMNTERSVLEWLQGRFGGKIYDHGFKKKPTNWRPGYQWHINQVDALEAFLRAIRPYLRIKGALTDNALEMIALKRRAGRGGPGGRTPVDLLARMDELHAIHDALITRGKPVLPVVPRVAIDPQLEMLSA